LSLELAMQAAVTADLERCTVAPESPALDYRLELAYLALTPE
jgi:hypothetical protein